MDPSATAPPSACGDGVKPGTVLCGPSLRADAAVARATCAGGARVTVFGYGSLLSRWSCLRTFTAVHNFRLAYLPNHDRAFSLVSLSSFQRGAANPETKEMCAVALRAGEAGRGRGVVGSVFEVVMEEVPGYVKREHRYEFAAAAVTIIDRNAPDLGSTVTGESGVRATMPGSGLVLRSSGAMPS